MRINLSNVMFINDFFTVSIPDGGLLVLNKIDESFLAKSSEEKASRINETTLTIKRINIEVVYDDKLVICPSVIGMNNDILGIKSIYTEILGSVLTADNMSKCEIEVYE